MVDQGFYFLFRFFFAKKEGGDEVGAVVAEGQAEAQGCEVDRYVFEDHNDMKIL